jgi:hypothetical protein
LHVFAYNAAAAAVEFARVRESFEHHKCADLHLFQQRHLQRSSGQGFGGFRRAVLIWWFRRVGLVFWTLEAQSVAYFFF